MASLPVQTRGRLESLIRGSKSLTAAKKKKILSLLHQLDKTQIKNLIKVLEDEKENLKRIDQKYLEEEGNLTQQYLQVMKDVATSAAKKDIRVRESEQKKGEDEELALIERTLEEMPEDTDH